MQYTVAHKIILNKNEPKHSEIGPMRQNPVQSTIVAHNTAQNRPDNFPCCPPDNHHGSDDVYLREGGGNIEEVFIYL